MKYLIIGLDIILCVWVLKWSLVFAYCHLKKKRDIISCESNRHRKKEEKEEERTSGKCWKQKLNNWLYGLVRWESIRVGRFPSMGIRKFVYRYFFAMEIDKKTVIYGGCELRSPWKIKLGKCVVGVSNVLDGRNGLIIEDGACLGSSVYIWTEQHDLRDKYFRCNDKGGTVIIGRHAWICSGSTILPKVTIGEGAVVACGAVMTHDGERLGVYAGIPARKTGNRPDGLDYEVCDNYWHFY